MVTGGKESLRALILSIYNKKNKLNSYKKLIRIHGEFFVFKSVYIDNKKYVYYVTIWYNICKNGFNGI